MVEPIIASASMLELGFAFYGYGYFLASLLSFLLTSIVLFSHIRKLPYHAFITNNNSLKDVFQELKPEQLKEQQHV